MGRVHGVHSPGRYEIQRAGGPGYTPSNATAPTFTRYASKLAATVTATAPASACADRAASVSAVIAIAHIFARAVRASKSSMFAAAGLPLAACTAYCVTTGATSAAHCLY